MAILHRRLYKWSEERSAYDTIHLETDASILVGILPVANGGTGTSSLDELVKSLNIGTTIEAGSITSSMLGAGSVVLTTDTVTGVLPVANGGTGCTSLTALSVALSIGDTSGTIIGATTTTLTYIGYDAIATGSNSVAIGRAANCNSTAGIAIGRGACSYATDTIAIGKNATATGSDSTAIGDQTTSAGSQAAAYGTHAAASGSYSLAAGRYATASGSNATAIGAHSSVSGAYSTAIGAYAVVSTDYTMQLGNATSLSTLSCKVALSTTSDIRDKADVSPVYNSREFLSNIIPIKYVYNHRLDYVPEDEYEDEDCTTLTKECVELHEKRSKYGIYDYDREAHALGTKKRDRLRVGVSAQNIREAQLKVYGNDQYGDLLHDSMYGVDPSDIEDGMENIISVNYSGFIPFLIDVVNELGDKVDELTIELENIKSST